MLLFVEDSLESQLDIGNAMLQFQCLSDTHGQIPPEPTDADITAWLHAGDFCDRGNQHLTVAERNGLERWTVERLTPVYSVQGNHDCGTAKEMLGRCTTDITGRLVEIAPTLFLAGVGWSGEKYYDLPGERELESACASVLHMARRKLFTSDHCILLTHYPAEIPKACTEPQFRCLHDLVEVLKPLVIVQGHSHALFGTQWLSPYGGLVINPGPTGGVLSIDLLQRLARFETSK
jgi:Icc-related predicted phosphoesterase